MTPIGLADPGQKAVFITFYSFKGGVGRTMSLINSALLLAASGRRVLMIDFDLEAPGLTTIQDLALGCGASRTAPGVVELIHDFLFQGADSPIADHTNIRRFQEEYVQHLPVPAHLHKKWMKSGCLDLMPCGKIDDEYSHRLNNLDFRAMYETEIGQSFFEFFKHTIQQSGLYDYVLIDSRTGFSDETGICTRDLADHIVVVMGLNRQNVAGTTHFVKRLNDSGWDKGQIVYAVSPVPYEGETLIATRWKAAQEALREVQTRPVEFLQIPYHARLALDENPFLPPSQEIAWPADKALGDAYQRMHEQLRALAKDTAADIQQKINTDVADLRFRDALLHLEELAALDPKDAAVLLGSIDASYGANPKLLRLARRFFELWEAVAGDDSRLRIRQRYCQILLRRGRLNSAAQEYETLLAEAETQQDEMNAILARSQIGNLLRMNGEYDAAERALTTALQSAEKSQQTALIAPIRRIFADLYFDQGQYDRAQMEFEELLKIYEALNDSRACAAIHEWIGHLHTVRGEYELGEERYQSTLRFWEKLADRNGIATLNADLGRIAYRRGDLDGAQAAYEAAIKVLQDQGDRFYAAFLKGSIGQILVQKGRAEEGLKLMRFGIRAAEIRQAYYVSTRGYADYAEALLQAESPEAARDYLDERWDRIERFGRADLKAAALVVRAQIREALGDREGAAASAGKAHQFYQEQRMRIPRAEQAAKILAACRPQVTVYAG